MNFHSPADTTAEEIFQLLEEVKDPEVPVLSIIDLGIVRKVAIEKDQIHITITPTYSGCPAMDVIKMNIRVQLQAHGLSDVRVIEKLSPPWTTDWMTEEGKRKLKEYGIAPPNPKQQVCDNTLFAENEAVQCPRCDSYHTRRVSEFGSTACKALYICESCQEPFDYFKCY